jgi:anti-sigma B factor antagonist
MEIIPGLGFKTLIPMPEDFKDFFQIKNQLHDLMKEGTKKYIMNLKNFHTLDSRGLGLMLQLHKDAIAAGGKLILLELQSPVRELINMCRLNSTFFIASNENEAKKELYND